MNKLEKEYKKLNDIHNKKYINNIMNKIKIIMNDFNSENILNNVSSLGELNIISYILFKVNLIDDELRFNLRHKFCDSHNIKPYVFYNIYVRDICYKKFINKYNKIIK